VLHGYREVKGSVNQVRGGRPPKRRPPSCFSNLLALFAPRSLLSGPREGPALARLIVCGVGLTSPHQVACRRDSSWWSVPSRLTGGLVRNPMLMRFVRRLARLWQVASSRLDVKRGESDLRSCPGRIAAAAIVGRRRDLDPGLSSHRVARLNRSPRGLGPTQFGFAVGIHQGAKP
jgi:hypothetical protein